MRDGEHDAGMSGLRIGRHVGRWSADETVVGLAGSASVNDRTLTLTVVNSHVSDPCDTTITVRGGRVSAAQAVTLGAADIHAHNTFERPSDVVPGPASALKAGSGGTPTQRFPPASVTRVTVTLG